MNLRIHHTNSASQNSPWHILKSQQGNLPIETVTRIRKHRFIQLKKGRETNKDKSSYPSHHHHHHHCSHCLVILNSPLWVSGVFCLPYTYPSTSVPTVASSGKLGESKAVKELASLVGLGWLVCCGWLVRFSVGFSKEIGNKHVFVCIFFGWCNSTPQSYFHDIKANHFLFF